MTNPRLSCCKKPFCVYSTSHGKRESFESVPVYGIFICWLPFSKTTVEVTCDTFPKDIWWQNPPKAPKSRGFNKLQCISGAFLLNVNCPIYQRFLLWNKITGNSFSRLQSWLGFGTNGCHAIDACHLQNVQNALFLPKMSARFAHP